MSEFISPIEEIIEEARNGKMFILADDKNRENEGDLIIPAQMATPSAINFMAKHGRGLICLALTQNRVKELNLPLMTQHNTTRYQTAFTVSIEAKEGVTTGISAPDRARTIATAIDLTKNADDIYSPGHIFPLVAHNGGVLVRAGHTEAAVDIPKLAGLNPSGVICEIMNEDGTMARMPELIEFSKKHDLKIGNIADLISYRLQSEKLVTRVIESDFESRYGGEFKMNVYSHQFDDIEHIALVKGKINPDKPTLVYVHTLNVLADVLRDTNYPKSDLKPVLALMENEEQGVIIVIRRLEKSVSNLLKIKRGESPKEHVTLKEYGVGAQILKDIGVQYMTLLSDNAPYLVGLDGYGLKVKGHRQIN